MTVITPVATTSTDETLENDIGTTDLTDGADFQEADELDRDGTAALPTNLFAMRAAFSGAVVNGGPLDLHLYNAIQIAGNAALDFTVTGNTGAIEDLAFTDSAGDPLPTLESGEPGLDSLLTTLDGDRIYLFSAVAPDGTANTDITLGYAHDVITNSYRLVFAIALDESLTAGNVGGTFYTALFEPLAHANPNDHNEALALPETLHIGATEALNFSFAKAPSGNALFMMFEDVNQSGIGIVVTGELPDDLTTTKRLNDGDTVNTGQGGGPTTLGSNGQQLKPNIGLVFTFVTDPVADFTVPNLSSPESSKESNIQFGTAHWSDGASFTVSQVTPTGSTFAVCLTAYAVANLVDGNQYVDGFQDAERDDVLDGTTVAITKVFITRNGVTSEVSFTLDPAAPTGMNIYRVEGVQDGDEVTYQTAADHNRVLIENAQPVSGPGSNITFDIGGFRLASDVTVHSPIGSLLQFLDDGPDVATTGQAPVLTTDDTDAGNGTVNGDTTPAVGVATASFAGAFTFAAGSTTQRDFGTDGAYVPQNATDPLRAETYALGLRGGVTGNLLGGVVDTATNQQVTLRLTAGGVIEAYVMDGTVTRIVFTISVDAAGEVTLTQLRAVRHDNPGDHLETGTEATTLAADLVTLRLTLRDEDGDTDAATVNIGASFRFEDDGPDMAAGSAPPDLRVDETDIAPTTGTSASTSFADAFQAAYGKDGQHATAPLTYALSVTLANGAAPYSGLNDSLSGDRILLRLNTTTKAVEGYLEDATGTLAFTIAVSASGVVTLTQFRAVEHDDPNHHDEADSPASIAAGLVILTATAKDGDGDTDSLGVDIGDNMLFEDDGPSVRANTPPPILTVDETDIGAPGGTMSASFLNAFLVSHGKDGPLDLDDNGVADAGAVTFALSLKDGATDSLTSNLVDSLTGQNVVLRMQADGSVQGYVTIAGAPVPVFTIAVNASGTVTLTQLRSIEHDNASDPDESTSPAILGADLVRLTATAYDGDDGASDKAELALNIGASFRFEDDGPTVTAGGAIPFLTTDDSDTPNDTASASFAGIFSVDFGRDGPLDLDDNGQDAGAVTYALGLKDGATTALSSGLTDTLSGQPVLLRLVNATTIEGYVATGNLLVFTITVAADGTVTLEQDRSLVHDDPLDHVESGTSAATLAADLVTLTATAYDGDDGASDSASLPRNIGAAFRFEDAGPTLAVTNLIGSGTTATQIGFWSDLAANDNLAGTSGKDGFASLSLTLDGYSLGGVAGTGAVTLTPTSTSAEIADGLIRFAGTIADLDGDGNTTEGDSLGFTLAFRDDGTYAFVLAAPRTTTSTVSSADGQLGAGGPDAVQTLTIPTNGTSTSFVFFNVRPTTDPDTIEAALGTGRNSDLTEAQIEAAGYPFIDTTKQMNVSTSGIGVGNNVLEGNGNAAIDNGNPTAKPAVPADESFLVNPTGGNVTGAKIYIDNSVAGYDTAIVGSVQKEQLHYRIYYEDGTQSGHILVTQGMLSDAGGGMKSFNVTSVTGEYIDAVQLTMSTGTVKIPIIEFSYEEKVVLPPVDLDFTATLFDKDGDKATAGFTIAVETDNDLTVEPDLFYTGTADPDSFVFDLTVTPDTRDTEIDRWTVTGFDSAEDTLVLLGTTTYLYEANVNAAGDDRITVGSKVITIANAAATLDGNDVLTVA